MNQQGGKPTGHEDDWWGQLYGDAEDAGPSAAPDSLDDRYASAAGAVNQRPDIVPAPPSDPDAPGRGAPPFPARP
ncbi:hypothetical protein ACFXDP_33065, partial [Streptomyces sp. NPDC059374]